MWECLFVIKKWSQNFHLCIEEKLEVAVSANLQVRVVYCSYGNKWERDKQSQTRKICFEVRTTCSMFPLSPLWKMFTIIARKITQCHNTYNELPQELLEPQIPHLFLQEQYTTRTCKFAEAATSNSSIQSKTLSDHFLIINKHSHNKHL